MKKIKIKLPGSKNRRKKNESSFSNFSFNTITSMASEKEGRFVKYIKSVRERISWFKGKDHSYSGSKATKKELVFKRLFVTAGVLGCCLLLFFGIQNNFVQRLVSSSDYAKVENVKVEGLNRLSVDDVYRSSGLVRFQTSMLDVEAEDVIDRVEQLTWVESVRVKFEWPSTIKIKVREQEPMALVHTPNDDVQFYYINRKGELFTKVEGSVELDYPIITGASKLDSEKYQASLNQALLFLKKIARNNPALPTHSVSEIHIDEKGQLVVYLVDHTFPIYIGESDIDKAYKYLVRVLEDVYRKRSRGASISEIGYIQLDYMKDRVLVSEDNSG